MKINISFSKSLVACFSAMICCLLWGSAFPFVKIGYEINGIMADDTSSQLLFAGIRFTVAGAMVIAFSSIISRKFIYPKGKSIYRVIKLSMFQTILQYFFYYIGISHTTGVKASVIVGTNVFMALFVSSLIYRIEKFTAVKLIGCLIGFIGVLSINIVNFSFDSNIRLNGEGFIFISTIAYAFSSVLMKRYSSEDNPMMLSGWQFLFGGIVMAVGGFFSGGNIGPFTTKSMSLMIYLAFVSAAAYSLWSILLKYNPVSKIAVYGFMNPVFGVLLSALLLGETQQAFSLNSLFALVMVSLGIYIVNGIKPKEA